MRSQWTQGKCIFLWVDRHFLCQPKKVTCIVQQGAHWSNTYCYLKIQFWKNWLKYVSRIGIRRYLLTSVSRFSSFWSSPRPDLVSANSVLAADARSTESWIVWLDQVWGYYVNIGAWFKSRCRPPVLERRKGKWLGQVKFLGGPVQNPGAKKKGQDRIVRDWIGPGWGWKWSGLNRVPYLYQ